MSKLSLLDLGFFISETQASPKHVGGLWICTPPPVDGAKFAKNLYEDFLTHSTVKSPFDKVIQLTITGFPHWKTRGVDLTQHIFYHKLPKGQNDQKSLYEFVSNLHVPMLDRSRPLWEMHVIDGYENGRFALYQKIHHAYADGVTVTRWGAEALSKSPNDMVLRPAWTLNHGGRPRIRGTATQELGQSLKRKATDTSLRFLGISRLAAMLTLESINLTKNAIALPFVSSAKTPLTGQITKGRQFATASISMERINKIRAKTRSTVNHVALTCLDGALHAYLRDQGIVLNQPIVIQMPVDLRRDDEKSAGNKIGIVLVELSPPTDDPYIRLRNIGYSLRNVRTMVDTVAPVAIESYTIVTELLAQIGETLNLSNSLPPLGNTLVSNVPGPKEYLYLMGAKVDEMHIVSTLPASNLLNITLFSYADRISIGLIATDDLPNLTTLAEYITDSFVELEKATS